MTKIVFLGDSVTYGIRAGVTQADTFAQKIGGARGFSEIVNAGVPSNSSVDGLARFEGDVMDQHPDALCIMFGINDVYQNIPVAKYKGNLRMMVARAMADGVRVTLMTPNLVRSGDYIVKFPPYLDAMREVAYERGAALVDCYLQFEDANFAFNATVFDALYVDAQHPSASGHQLITGLVLKPYNSNACA